MKKNRLVVVAVLTLVFLLNGRLLVSQESQGNTFQILVQKFTLDTVESNTVEELDILNSLQTTLKRFKDLEVLDHANYPKLSNQGLQNKDSLDAIAGVDAIIFGSYVVLNNYLKIDPVIYDKQEKLYYRLSYSRGTVTGIETLVDEVGDDVYNSLVEISPRLQGRAKRIALISDFEEVNNDYKNAGPIRKQSDELTKQVLQSLDYLGPDNTDFISWNDLQEYSDKSSAEVIKSLNLDMYMSLTFVFEGTQLVGLKSDFNIIEKSRDQIQKRDFELPEIKNDYYGDYDFIEFAINELNDFFDLIITDKGQWDISAFPNKTSTKSVSAENAINKAENAFSRNKFYLSNYYYYDVLNRFPDQISITDIRLQIGFNKVYLDRLEEADQEFDFVLSTNTDAGYAYLGKSLIKYYNAEYQEALKLLQEARDKGLDNQFIFEVLKGYYKYELQEYDEALSSFEKGLSTDPGVVKIRIVNYFSMPYIKIHVGLCLVQLGRFEDAVNYYNALANEFKYNNEIPYYIGNAYSEKGINEYFNGNYEQALADFSESRKSYVNPNINDYIRESYIRTGKYAEAEAFINGEIDAGNYDNFFTWQLHAMDLRALLLERYDANGQLDKELAAESIRIYQINLLHNPEDHLSYYYMGEIYVLLGDLENGAVNLQKAFEMNSMDFDIQTGLLQVYLLNNDFDSFDRLSRSLSRLNRKFVVPDRTQALVDFLNISAALVQDKKAKKEERSLSKLMDAEVVIDNWIYAPYLTWVENCACEQAVKDELAKLTDSMKSRSLN